MSFDNYRPALAQQGGNTQTSGPSRVQQDLQRFTPQTNQTGMPQGSSFSPSGCGSQLEQMEMGMRFPRPYDASMAEIMAENAAWWPGQTPDLHPRHAVYTHRDIAGQRRWSGGGYGVGTAREQMDSRMPRQRAGARTDGGRGVGLIDAYDLDGSNFRYSGSLTQGSLEVTSQRVPCDRPVIRLISTGGMMRVRATIGSANGGAEDTREFFLGNGYQATFDLAAWDFFKLRILQTDATSKFSWAWISGQSAAGNQELILVQHLGIPNVPYDVPQGSFEAVFKTTDTALRWDNTTVEGVGASTFDVNAPAGAKIPVIGFQVQPTVINRVSWFIRPF